MSMDFCLSLNILTPLSPKFYMDVERIMRWMSKYVEFFNKHKTEEIVVVHHNDADGLCAGTILRLALEELGHEVRTICIEKTHEKLVERIHEKWQCFTIYTDLAGFVPDMIAEKCGNTNVLIIDHHPMKRFSSRYVRVLDLEAVGISGSQFITASSLCYFFTRKLGIKKELSHLAVIGAVGDYHDRSGGLLGFDRLAFNIANMKGLAKMDIGEVKERYYIKPFKEYADIIAEKLGLLGFVGYYQKGYRDGMRALIKGFDKKVEKKVEQYRALRDRKYKGMIKKLKGGELSKKRKVQWFNLKKYFHPMGVKTVGNFCQIIKDMEFVDENKYLIGMQYVPKNVPELGRIDWNLTKVSGRVPYPLERRILEGSAVGFNKLFPAVTQKVGGTVDAIHSIAAATLITRGKEEEFVRWFDRYAQSG